MSIEIPGKPASAVVLELANSSQKDVRDDAQRQTKSDLPSTQQDEVNVSSMAKKLDELSKIISDQPIVDSQRISSIKHDIEHGSYQVNSGRVAEKFFRFELALHH